MATKAEVRNKVLYELGLLSRGQTATAEDADDIEAAIDEVQDELVALDIAVFDVDVSIPAYLVNSFVSMVAGRRVYLASTERMGYLSQGAVSGEREYRRLIAGKYQNPEKDTDY